MAVTEVRRTWAGRGGENAAPGSSRRTRTFLAKTNSKLDTEEAVLTSGLVPVPYTSTLPENPFFLCVSCRATQKSETPYAWDVEAEYSIEIDKDEKEKQQYPNPLTRPPVISWDSQQYEKPVAKDINGDAVMNSANDPYDPPLMQDDARWVISIATNAGVVPTFVLTLNNRVNDTAVTVDGVAFAAKTLKVQGLRIGAVKEENGILFREVSYQLHYRSETWNSKPLDAGFSELVSGDRREILLDDGTKPSVPWPLNGAGAKLASPTPSTAVYRDFEIYHATALTVLPGVT
jgi:hypothetical protein